MSRTPLPATRIVQILEEHHVKSQREIKKIQDALINIRFEGKVSLGKNIAKIREVLQYYDRELIPHIHLEDKIIFPFIAKHVPKVQCIIRLLQSEHNHIKHSLQVLRKLTDQLVKTKTDLKRVKIIEKIYQAGTYFVFLVDQHIQTEQDSIYTSIKKDLKKEEALGILRLMKWLTA